MSTRGLSLQKGRDRLLTRHVRTLGFFRYNLHMLPEGNLHHAYFIEGEKRAVLAEIEEFLKKVLGMADRSHPDIHVREHQSFGIDESKMLQNMQSMKPVAGAKKIFIIVVESMTNEAQNSLLKVFEEPTVGTHFFIISSSQRILLPTLRSRVAVITHHSAKNLSSEEKAKDFISMSPRERLAYVSEIIEEKDRAKAENFLNAIVSMLHKKKVKEKGNEVKEILSLSKYLKDRSPSLKLILERISLLDL